ncbi:hypothetical protein FBU30_007087 [Linnemannia zychae]|nr:hypothetical protein FBU30_007087 [Linnemannia zychae]
MTVGELEAIASSLPHAHGSTSTTVEKHQQHDWSQASALSNSTLVVTKRELVPTLQYIRQFKSSWLTGLKFERVSDGTVVPYTNIIHKILCSCLNLIEFTSLSIYYYLEDMDVNNLLSAEGKYRSEDEPVRKSEYDICRVWGGFQETAEELPTNPRPTWVCRNLRTLHLAVTARSKDQYNSAASLVVFGYLSLICPRLEQLHLKRECTNLRDEGGICLLGRLKHLKRLLIHSIYRLDDVDVYWLRPRHIQAAKSDRGVKALSNRFLSEDTLLGRMIRASQNRVPGSDLLSSLKKCLMKLSELPAFQVRKPFLTEDGIDLGSVGRPDDLILWIYNTNQDLMGDGHIQGDDDNTQEREKWEKAFLPKLEFFCLRKPSNYAELQRNFMKTQRPDVEFLIQTCNYYI